MGERYQWYVKLSCGGVSSKACLYNFWTTYSQSVNTLVDTNWNKIQKEILFYNKPKWIAQERWDAAGLVLNATLKPNPEWIISDPDHNPDDRSDPFDVGILKASKE